MRDKKEKKGGGGGGGKKRGGEEALAAVRTGAAISSIETPRTDPNLRRVKVSGEVVVTLPVSAVDALGISVGTKWSPELTDRVKTALDSAKARKSAMKLLSRKGFSRDEVRQRLEKRGYSAAVAGQVVGDLASSGWIDDKAVAEATVHEVERRGGGSREFVKRTLRERGVGDEDAEEATASSKSSSSSSSSGESSDVRSAEEFARKRLGKLDAELKPAVKARRVARALAGRGFDDEIISEVLGRVIPAGGARDSDDED